MKKAHVGIYGAGAMGVALARNFGRNKIPVAIANRTIQTDLKKNLKKYKESKYISYVETLEDLVKSVKGPIILLIPSGDPQEDLIHGESTTPIDEVIFSGTVAIYPEGRTKKVKPLIKLVTKNHIIIDAGNSHPYGTALRDVKLTKMGIKFLGMGVSGGEMGALKGPSLMPGGARSTYKKVATILKKVAAKKGKTICCDWMGPSGAGHLVKIIHNGIEYAIMQGIAEAYWMLKHGLGLTNEEMKELFAEWNRGIFKSYLLEITTHILGEKDTNSKYILDEILDSAGAKGTGKWTTQIASDLGIPAGTIYAALEARQISNKKQERQTLAKLLIKQKQQGRITPNQFIPQIRDALYSLILIAYTQGFLILNEASNESIYTAPLKNYLEKGKKKIGGYTKTELNQKLDFVKIANVWKAGCIIRSNLLEIIERIFAKNKENLLKAKEINKHLQKFYPNWKKAAVTAIQLNLPYQATTAALHFYNSFRSEKSSANLIQAQRDLFGAHTFEKLDGKTYHHYWGKKYSI